MATVPLGKIDGKYKYKTPYLSRLIKDFPDSKIHIDHIDHDTLNNRKYNLRLTDASHNARNRNGANKNSGTGVRNVNYGANHSEYWVQFCRDNIRFKWKFPLDKFEEACEFAKKKRIELFKDFSGNG